jgi:O-antigen ligase
VVATSCAAAGIAGGIVFLLAVTISPASLPTLAPSSRVLTWTGAWHTFLAHPLLGRGLGLEVADVRYLNASGSYELLTDAHNTWLSVMAQDGVVGLAALALVVFTLARRMRMPDFAEPPASIVRRGLELALLGGFLYQTLSGSFENTRHVWVLMGLVDAAQALAPDL